MRTSSITPNRCWTGSQRIWPRGPLNLERIQRETYVRDSLFRDLLLPEIEAEFGKTRRLFEALPDGETDFQPYAKSMPLGRLAGHTTDLFRIITMVLTFYELDMAIAWKPDTMESKSQLPRNWKRTPAKAFRALRRTSDETFHQQWRILRGHSICFPASAILPTAQIG